MKFFLFVFVANILGFFHQIDAAAIFSNSTSNNKRTVRQSSITLGSCVIALNRKCPDPDIKFFLYTQQHPEIPEAINVSDKFSNISDSAFDPKLPTKIIVHGYNSDMYLAALVEIKKQYIIRGNYNIFAVDWSPLARGPCYPGAVWNSKFVGKCASRLIQTIRDTGVIDIHLIGFSLGAHVTAFMSNNLAPYKVPRITGLDPAMPGFSTVSNENKLDPSDGDFVDVLHTNAFLQGVVQQSGHVDFYMNGGVFQPGCWAEVRFFACNHHRAPLYFAESVNSRMGFWGWPCTSYFNYLIGNCPPREPQIIMGENVNKTARGMHLVITDSVSPFAVGKFTGPLIEIYYKKNEQNRIADYGTYKTKTGNCSILHDLEEEIKRRQKERYTLEDFDDLYFHADLDVPVVDLVL